MAALVWAEADEGPRAGGSGEEWVLQGKVEQGINP